MMVKTRFSESGKNKKSLKLDLIVFDNNILYYKSIK